MLTVVLQDSAFASQTADMFEAVFKPKVDAFLVLEKVLSFESVDFIVAFSSVSGFVGNAGQTNYAA